MRDLLQKKIPKLRFPEFRDDLVGRSLESLSERIGDGIHSTPKYDTSGQYYFINGNNLVNGAIELDENTKRLNYQEYKKHERKLGSETILISINGTIGNVALYNNERITLGKSACYINTNSDVDRLFHFYTLNTPRIQRYFISELTGSTIKNLSLKSISKTLIYLPNKTEQQKIASFLSSVDAWINNLKAQKEELEKYKKGMMQKIFSQKIRFKDENQNDYPEWDKRRFEEVADIKMGQSPDSKAYNSEGNGMYLIQGNADIQGRKINPRSWTTQFTKVSKEGDIIMTVRAPVGLVAKSSINSVVGRGVCAIKGKNFVVQDFIYQFLLFYENKWIKFSQGSTFSAVNSSDIKNLNFPAPILDEQQKIASFLSSMDAMIVEKESQIKQAEIWKKGLIQKLFV